MNHRLILLFCFLWQTTFLFSQTKYNNNWYFGDKAALDFNFNPPAVKTDSRMSTYRSAASVSDEITGELLFYTNGNSFWNHLGEMIDSSFQGSAAQDVIILPLKKFKNRFIVFNFTSRYIIDMTARNGRGSILEKTSFSPRTTINRMTAVKNCLSESYWLITLENNFFCAYLVHPDGIIDAPVTTLHNQILTPNYVGDFVSSNNGEKLALTCYAPIGNIYYEPQIFNFNKRCGTVEASRVTLPMKADWDRPHGIAFSPNDQLIYVTYGYQESQLVQYVVNNPADNRVIATSPENFNQIACGPDGKLYITTHISGIPSNKMDAVLNPNVQGAGCNYRENYLRLNGVTNFEVPNMIMNHTGTCQENTGYQLSVDKGACFGNSVTFKLTGSQSGIDSIKWFYNDPLNPGKYSTNFNTNYNYPAIGSYQPFAVIYSCNHHDTTFLSTTVTPVQSLFLGNDTTLCNGESLNIGNALLKGQFQWNTGETNPIKTIKQAGLYILINNNNDCIISDTILINYYLPLQTLLGDLYFICEEDKELVELNAGKGFKYYLWYPTKDTTQWIEVSRKGNYFVVVGDYRGCKGEDNTIVEERCDLYVYIPNAFSPNGDGLNDVFAVAAHNANNIELEIYSRWGELIFKGKNNGWDGRFKGELVPQDVYMVKAKVSGFLNKKTVQKTYSGTVQLLGN